MLEGCRLFDLEIALVRITCGSYWRKIVKTNLQCDDARGLYIFKHLVFISLKRDANSYIFISQQSTSCSKNWWTFSTVICLRFNIINTTLHSGDRISPTPTSGLRLNHSIMTYV
jgi:hypothetical protein